VVISAGSVGSAELNGFTIKDGNANGPGGNLTVLSQSIYSYEGGGLELTNSSPVLTNITVSANNSISIGGGINNYNSSPVLYYVNIIGNIAGSGGGIYNNSSSPTISNTIISGNIAGSSGAGGGIYNLSNSSPVFTNVTISGNTAGNGGGIINNGNSSPVFTNVTISGNFANYNGGGMLNNQACSPKIRNTIIYGNSTGIVNGGGSAPAITYSLVQGLTDESNGNISGDKNPLFVNQLSPGLSTDGDYRLQSTSPVVDKGNNDYFNAGASPDLTAIKTDLDGKNRFKNVIDFGAYEYGADVLPVEVVTYTAQAEGTIAKLKWTTATEKNSIAFIISRSSTGTNFKEIGNVAGSGNTSAEKDYVFYDENPLNGINFYQLFQVDYDGKKTDLGIRAVNFASVVNNLIKVYPNPVKNSVRIEFASNTYTRLELTEVSGKVLQQIQLSVIDTEKKMDMSNLPSGVYFIKLAGSDKVESRKVVKE
jgi:hypothetical protein